MARTKAPRNGGAVLTGPFFFFLFVKVSNKERDTLQTVTANGNDGFPGENGLAVYKALTSLPPRRRVCTFVAMGNSREEVVAFGLRQFIGFIW